MINRSHETSSGKEDKVVEITVNSHTEAFIKKKKKDIYIYSTLTEVQKSC